MSAGARQINSVFGGARPGAGRMAFARGSILPRAPVYTAAETDLIRRLDARPLTHLTPAVAETRLTSGTQPVAGESAQTGVAGVTLHDGAFSADAGLIAKLGVARCLRESVAPAGRAGGVAILATSRPHYVIENAADLRMRLGPFRVLLASSAAVERALLRSQRARLANHAETCIARDVSCRRWQYSRARVALVPALIVAAGLSALWPRTILAVLSFWVIAMLAATSLLKIVSAGLALDQRRRHGGRFQTRRSDRPDAHAPPRPHVSILVPLFREAEIADHLVRRLTQLTYPKDRLEVCLLLEADDPLTRAAIARTDLPAWMRVIEVPPGRLKTKPRALNYALGFCRGEIVGIYDAEDAPAPDQIELVADTFAAAPPEVVCLQGALDYYNAHQNWLARAFTIEYATWFRLILPGLARTGLVVPLGGTTLFFRRDALERIGGWDAWNVTEDADLGVRLARHGWRTELIPSATGEEANCRPWPWIRQRSRWLKGYAMTWATHMRHPVRLWRDLGSWRFLGLQIVLLGTLSQFLLAPVLWSFWALPLGLPHPLEPVIGRAGMLAAGGIFFVAEIVNMLAAWIALATTRHCGLARYVPTMMFYFPLAAVAAWKAMFEVVTKPFFWDKTSHGLGAMSEDWQEPGQKGVAGAASGDRQAHAADQAERAPAPCKTDGRAEPPPGRPARPARPADAGRPGVLADKPASGNREQPPRPPLARILADPAGTC